MTSMPVMDKSSGVRNILSGKTAKTNADSISGGFGQFMKQSNASGTERSEAVEIKDDNPKMKVKDSSDSSRADAVRERMDRNSQEDMKSQKTDVKEKTPEEIAQDQTKVAEAVGQMITVIAQELGVTQQQVEDAMQQLQISGAELLTQDGVKNVMIALTEGADQMSLLTDETLYQSVTEVLDTLEQTVDQLAQSMGMDNMQFEDYVQEMISSLQKVAEDTGTETLTGPLTDNVEETAFHQTLQNTAKDSGKSESVTGNQEGEMTKTEENSMDIFKTDMQKQFREQSEQSGQENHFMQGGFGNSILQSQGLTQGVADVQTAFQMPDTREIMDQIMDYMKIQMKPEMTNLEMQLHPESLGTLHIQISSREGVMTAQFTTQNAEVKAVLESQMMELKTNLEQQGIKVEAVEVTIAEYTLNQNFSGDTSGQNRQMGEQKKGRSVIRIEDLDSELEELSTEEKLTAEMMQSEGTTVNYTA